MMKYKVINIDPEIMGGTSVFYGTRVPIQTLFDYLEGGDDVDEFLDDFSSVSREAVLQLLEMAKKTLTTERTVDELTDVTRHLNKYFTIE